MTRARRGGTSDGVEGVADVTGPAGHAVRKPRHVRLLRTGPALSLPTSLCNKSFRRAGPEDRPVRKTDRSSRRTDFLHRNQFR
jgi:hypothetical protein